MTLQLTEEFLRDSEAIHKLAMQSLFERLDSLCEGAIAVDKHARIVWINNKYLSMLGINSAEEALGKEVEEVIPNSLMREVVQTGQPILLDIMEFGEQSFVVTRMPLRNWGRIINIASAHGLVASATKVAYVAAKHGVVGLRVC